MRLWTRWSAPVALLAWVTAAPAAPAAFAQARSPTQLEVAVPFAPQAVTVGGAARLFYEFHLVSHARQGGALDEIAILDGDTGDVLSDQKGPALDGLIRRAGVNGALAAEPRRIAPGSSAVVFMETTLPVGRAAPKTLRWRVSFSPDAETAETKTIPLTPILGDIAVDQHAPITIGFPLPTGTWVAFNGPSNTANHRRTLIVVDGRAGIAQRYAIDWIKLGPDGRPFHGDRGVNANWYSFGTDVLAVADATVRAAHDGLPLNEPDKLAVPITLETIGGNYLILDLGGGHYAFYAHLQPGSQRVHVGDNVKRGQVIALLGNTGNSSAPHLHFQIANANDPSAAEGVPYVFAAFSSLGVANLDLLDGPGGWKPDPAHPPTLRKDALPAENEVVDIP